jgi:hypothetical protein
MRYPESASELQQWCPWEATRYNNTSSKVDDDEVTMEVADISETLVFQLISAFLRGSEYLGDTIMLEFQPHKYRNISTQFPNLLTLITTPPIARKNKQNISQRAVVVDVERKAVVLATGDIVPCQ